MWNISMSIFRPQYVERFFLYGAPYEWNKLDERVRRLTDFNMLKSEIKTVLFLRYVDN